MEVLSENHHNSQQKVKASIDIRRDGDELGKVKGFQNLRYRTWRKKEPITSSCSKPDKYSPC